MNGPLVSVTCAYYNAEDTLPDAVKAIFAQTYKNWELILLDDGSTDSSLKIARSIKHPKVKIYNNGENIGRARSLNRLTTLCQGTYVARMDADDLCASTRLERQVELLESDSGIDLAGTGICYLDRSDHPVGYYEVPYDHTHICRTPLRTFGLCHGSVMARKKWFEKNRYDENLRIAVDFNLWLRSYKNSRFSNVPDPLYYYRLDNSFHLRKLVSARISSARFLFKHCISLGDPFAAISGYTAQYLKLIITALAFLSGMRANLMKRRFTLCGPEQNNAFQKEIRKIKEMDIGIAS